MADGNNGEQGKRAKTFHLTLLPILAALGFATKPFIAPIANIITEPLLIPGGSTAGGFFMMWLLLGRRLTGIRGAAAVMGLLQGFMALATGITGFQGIWCLPVYSLPGVAIELVFPSKAKPADISGVSKARMMAAGTAANVTGTLMTTTLFFSLSPIPLALCICLSVLSGGFGGWLAHVLYQRLIVILKERVN